MIISDVSFTFFTRSTLFEMKWNCSVVSDSLQPHGLQPQGLYSPWNSPGQDTGVGSQGIFPTQGLNLGLWDCRQILYQLSYQGSPSTLFQFSSVQSLSRVRLFATPWITAHQASLPITNSRSLLSLDSNRNCILLLFMFNYEWLYFYIILNLRKDISPTRFNLNVYLYI